MTDNLLISGGVSHKLVLSKFKHGSDLMDSVGAYEAKTHFSKLLERVIKGEKITITKHGVPLAILQPLASSRKTTPRQVIAAIRQFRDKHTLDGLSIRKMIEEGRR